MASNTWIARRLGGEAWRPNSGQESRAPPHHDARMDGGAIHRSIKESLVGNGPVARMEDRDEDLVAPPAMGFERRRFAVSAPSHRSRACHPSCVQLEDGVHPRAVHAMTASTGRSSPEPSSGIEYGGLGADGGGKRGIGRHDGSILGSVGERLGGSPPPLDRARADAPLDLSDGSRQAVASPGRIPASLPGAGEAATGIDETMAVLDAGAAVAAGRGSRDDGLPDGGPAAEPSVAGNSADDGGVRGAQELVDGAGGGEFIEPPEGSDDGLLDAFSFAAVFGDLKISISADIFDADEHVASPSLTPHIVGRLLRRFQRETE